MTTRTLLLGAAAAVSLSLSPALAEMLSSPQEMSQTRALNASAQSGTYTSPCTLNGEKALYRSYSRKAECPSRHARTKTRTHASTYARNYHATTVESGRSTGRMTETQTAQTPTTYNNSSYRYGPNGYSSSQQQTYAYGQSTQPTYGQSNGQYQGRVNGQYSQSQTYGEQRDYGENESSRMPYGAQGHVEGQVATNQTYGERSYGEGARGTYEEGAYAPQSRINPDDFVSLKAVDPEHLDHLSVETSSGIVVGRVTDVNMARDGSASIIGIALNDGREVRVSASTLKFNPNERVLLTNLDQHELMAMAGEDRY